MESIEQEAPKFIFRDGPVKGVEDNLRECARIFGLSHVKEKALDGRFRTVQYDMVGIPDDGCVQLKALCFGKIRVPGTQGGLFYYCNPQQFAQLPQSLGTPWDVFYLMQPPLKSVKTNYVILQLHTTHHAK